MLRQGHYHFHMGTVSRSKGHSAVAAAAYQSGQSLTHEQQRQFTTSIDHRKQLNKGSISDGLRHAFASHGLTLSDAATAEKDGRRDWTIKDGDAIYQVREVEKKVLNKETGKRETVSRDLDIYADRTHSYTTREDVIETWIQAPTHVTGWIKLSLAKGGAVEKKERESLWNAAEAADIARDARTARKFQMALSRGLSYEQNKALLREYVAEHFTNYGMIADVAIHEKKASDGKLNTHAHVLITTREITAQGEFTETKNTYWEKRDRVHEWRQAWADKVNAALEQSGKDIRIDHRSYKKQGVDVIPGEHVGASEWNREQRGEHTDKKHRNEEIERHNADKDRYWNILQQRVRSRRPEVAAEKEIPKEYYAGRTTIRRSFGFGGKTTHTYLPGMSSLPRKQRAAIEQSTPRLTTGEQYERITEYHNKTLAGYVANNQTGGNPRDAMEHIQRLTKTIKQKAEEVTQQIRKRYRGWVDRINEERQKQQQRDDRER